MKIFRKIFARRQQEARGEIPVVWNRDVIPENVVNQIWMEWMDTFGKNLLYSDPEWKRLAARIHRFLCKELGAAQLGNSSNDIENLYSCLRDGFPEFRKVDIQISVIEEIIRFTAEQGCYLSPVSYDEHEALTVNFIEVVNFRLREGRIGYQFNLDAKSVLPFDDEIIYENAVIPAFNFLNINGFENAKKEFKDAFDYYVKREYENSVMHTIKSLEIAIKTLIGRSKRLKTAYGSHDGLSKLIDIIFGLEQFQSAHADFAAGLKNVFKEIAQIRNKEAAHGKEESRHNNITDAKAKLVLNLAATLLTFFAENEVIFR